MLWRKIKQEREGNAGIRVAILNGVVGGGLTKVTCEQRPEEGEGRLMTGTWEQCSKEGEQYFQSQREDATWLV